MDSSSWAVVIAAGLGLVGVVVTVMTQTLVNRGEPAKLRTLRFLNEALEKYDVDDEGRSELRSARQKLASELATSLTSPTFRQAFQAQMASFTLSGGTVAAIGTGVTAFILFAPTIKQATGADLLSLISLSIAAIALLWPASAAIEAFIRSRR